MSYNNHTASFDHYKWVKERALQGVSLSDLRGTLDSGPTALQGRIAFAEGVVLHAWKQKQHDLELAEAAKRNRPCTSR